MVFFTFFVVLLIDKANIFILSIKYAWFLTHLSDIVNIEQEPCPCFSPTRMLIGAHWEFVFRECYIQNHHCITNVIQLQVACCLPTQDGDHGTRMNTFAPSVTWADAIWNLVFDR